MRPGRWSTSGPGTRGAGPSVGLGLGLMALGLALRSPEPEQAAASPSAATPTWRPTSTPSPTAWTPPTWKSGLPPLLPDRLPPAAIQPSWKLSRERLRAFVQAAPILAHGYRLFEPARYWNASNQHLEEGRYAGAQDPKGRVDHQDFLERYLALVRRGQLVGWRRLSLHFRGEDLGGPHVDLRLSARVGFNLISWRDPLGLVGAAQANMTSRGDPALAAAFVALVEREELPGVEAKILQGIVRNLRGTDTQPVTPDLAYARLREHERALAQLPFDSVRWSAWFKQGQGEGGVLVRRRLVRRVLPELISRQPVLLRLYARVLGEEAAKDKAPTPRAAHAARGDQRGVLLLTRILRVPTASVLSELAAWSQREGHADLARALSALSILAAPDQGLLGMAESSSAGASLKASSWSKRGELCDAALVSAGALRPLPGADALAPAIAPPPPRVPPALAPGDTIRRFLAELSLRNSVLRRHFNRGLRLHAQGQSPAQLQVLLDRAERQPEEPYGDLVAVTLGGGVRGATRLGYLLAALKPQVGLCWLHTAIMDAGVFEGDVEGALRRLIRALRVCYERHCSPDDEPFVARIIPALDRLGVAKSLPQAGDADWQICWRAHQHLRRALDLPHELGPPPHLEED